MGLKVIQPGLKSTIQDQGRPGYRHFGVPIGGAFDRASMDLANALLGNDPDASALELTLIGGVYRAEVSIAVALTGAPFSVSVRADQGSDREIIAPQSWTLRAGDELVIGGSPTGARCYLAVQGGWQSPVVLGSRSTEVSLQGGEILRAITTSETATRRPVAWPWAVSKDRPALLRVVDGPDARPGEAQLMEQGEYRVTVNADRMGLRLEGPAIDRTAEADRPSAPLAPGSVQITGGQPIVLGVAGGTMGGYLHLAHVISSDLDRLGQLRPADVVRFQRVEVETARELDRHDRLERARWLTMIRASAASASLA